MTVLPDDSLSGSLRVGIACFSTFGGSGVIASEIGLTLAAGGHQVHVFSDERPSRLGPDTANLVFHPVEARAYPQLKDGSHALALTSKIVDVVRREGLDILHAHYAVPHAISAYLARQVLSSRTAPGIVTTLHGTDITLVGSDPTFLPLTRFSIVASDAVTAPSAWLAEATHRMLDVPRAVPIDVIPNFVDTERFSPAPVQAAARGSAGQPFVLVHVSNFRSLKRVGDVVRVFAETRARMPASDVVLRLVGDGPDRQSVGDLVQSLGLSDRVEFLGERIDLPSVLRASDLFLLPSESESFGLAALEALSCGVPVVASNVGGIPEVVTDGEVGFLAALGDVTTMAAHVARLLGDGTLRRQFSAAARRQAQARFPLEPTVARYEVVYRRVLAARAVAATLALG